jgi:group I intron endonuclease
MSETPTIKHWTIYKITNPVGQVYIGKTSNWEHRYSQHKKLAHKKNNTLITNSLIEFGPNNHQFEIVEKFDSDSEFADGKEIFWIRTYMSQVIKWPQAKGLNVHMGGSNGNIGGRASEKQKEIARITHRGNKYGLGRKEPEDKKKLRIDKLKGQKRSFDSVVKLRASNLRTKGKAILQYDQYGNYLKEFAAISIAEKETGISEQLIIAVLKGRQEKTKGFIFKYK